MNQITLQEVTVTLAKPIEKPFEWIGQDQVQNELQACWLKLHSSDQPLTPRLIGLPGSGKTTLAAATAQTRKQDLYIMQCTADTRPEDLIITPVLNSSGKIAYHASPLLTAAITGGVAILDEGNRMSEKSWASLAGLLDHRRTVESIVAGITIEAHPEFRCAVTMNEDDTTFEIPDYIISRLQPQIRIGFPTKEEEMRILKYSIPFAPNEILDLAVSFLQRSHAIDLPYSIRDAISAVRYALKEGSLKKSTDYSTLFTKALAAITGEIKYASDGNDMDSRNDPPLYPTSEMNLEDYYFDEDDDFDFDEDDMDDDDLDTNMGS